MKIAIVHDWLTEYAGAERVLEQMLLLYPDADLFAVCDFLSDTNRHFLGERNVTTTFIQNMPGARKLYRNYLPLMPLAIEQLDLSSYDIVLSSSHAVAKGVITGPDQFHISYVHSPMRYAWDLQHQYLKESGMAKGLKSWIARWVLHKIRMWDISSSYGVDAFLANSHYIARRIQNTYRCEANVIYPPVDVSAFELNAEKETFYLAASRMVPYKRMGLIAEAFSSMPNRQLTVIGDGPEYKKVKSLAGRNIKILGYQPANVLRDYLQKARAFVFAAEEDFGILPVEAQACGTPVIAYRRGGVLETVRGLEQERPTGVFFDQQSVEGIVDGVNRFEQIAGIIKPVDCRENAERFSVPRFRKELQWFVAHRWEEFHATRGY